MRSPFKVLLVLMSLVALACNFPVVKSAAPPVETPAGTQQGEQQTAQRSPSQPEVTVTETLADFVVNPASSPVVIVTAIPTSAFVASVTPTNTIVPAAAFTATLVPTNTQIPAATQTYTPIPTNTKAPPPANTQPPPTITSVPQSAACSPAVKQGIEGQIIDLINQERNKEGLAPLAPNGALRRVARSHSIDMACNNFFSHTSPTTGSPFDRIAAEGYSYSWAGENIAGGYGAAAGVVDTWMNSQGHRDNILNPNFTEIGVGYVNWGDSDYGNYTTAVFASP